MYKVFKVLGEKLEEISTTEKESIAQELCKDTNNIYILADELPKEGVINEATKEGFFKLENKKIIPDKEKKKEYWEKMQHNILSDYIFSLYPYVKQQSDQADRVYYRDLLKIKKDTDGHLLYPSIEELVIGKIVEVENGKTLDEVLEDIPNKDKEAFSQLIKGGLRIHWVQKCKAELKKAIKEDREPNYPKYPL